MNYKTMTPIEIRTISALSIVFSSRMFGMFMILPVLPIYGISLQGANRTLIGVAIGIYGFTQAIFQIPFGLLSDRLGRKKIILCGLLLFFIGSIISAMTTSIWGVIIGRALQGTGAISSVIMAFLSDLIREQNITTAMACIGISFGVTFALSIICGPIITHALGLHSLFWIISIFAVFSILTLLVFVPNPDNNIILTINRNSSIIKDGIKAVLINKKLLKINISILYLHLLLMMNFIALPANFEKIGFLTKNHWKVYLITILISFFFVIPCMMYAERKHRMRCTLISCVFFLFISEFLFWFGGNHFYALVISLQLFFIAFNVLECILPSLISKESPLGYKGTAMGLYSTSQFIGVAMGGSIGGYLYGHFNSEAIFLFNIILSLSWLLMTISIKEPHYFSDIHIVLNPSILKTPNLEILINDQPGVISVLLLPEENSAYIKINNKITNYNTLKRFLKMHEQ